MAQPWVLDPAEAVVRRVHEGANDGWTTIWVRLRPRLATGQAGPTDIVLATQFRGRTPPENVEITLHVMSDVRISPLVPRVERLSVTIDGKVPIDFLAPDERTVLAHCCGDLMVPIPVGASLSLGRQRLDLLAAASSVEGNALGVPFSLGRTEIDAVSAFRLAVTR